MVTSAAGSSQGDSHEEIVKVLDFGIAKMMGDSDGPMGVVETQAGTVFGTPRYMSPEQAQGKPLDARTDLYSLGVIVYQMLTGRPPFTDNDAVVVMARHIKSVPKRPNEVAPEANVPKELEDVVMRALSKDPAERQASADVFAGELLAALEAQGATTSGVRASITNAAGIRVPDSMRPPAISLPPPPANKVERAIAGVPLVFIVAALPVIILVAAAGVYLGLRSGKPPARGPAVTATASPTSPSTTATATSETIETSSPPVVTPDALPTAQPTISVPAMKAAPPYGKGGRTPKGATAPRPTSSAPTAPTSTYGVFE